MDATNKTQLQTTGATLIGIAAGYLAGKGYLGLSVGDWTTVLTALAVVGPPLWAAFSTRAKSLKDTVGGLKNTTVVTDAETAKALPNNPDVIAATPKVVAAINEVKMSQ